MEAIVEILKIVVGGLVGYIGAWLKFRVDVKRIESDDNRAENDHELDAARAYADLQIQLATATENLIEPLNEQVQQLRRENILLREELIQLRDFVQKQSQEMEQIKTENIKLTNQVFNMQSERLKNFDEITDLKNRIKLIRENLDTGDLPPLEN